MPMVILHTNHGDITLELDAENAPATVANFLQYVRDGHYDNTIFHRVIDGFMIQGGGMAPGMKQKPTRAAGRQRSRQRAQEQALHGRDGAHLRPAFGDRAILHQRRRQRFPRPQGAEPAGLGLLRLRQGHRRAGHRRPDQGRADGQQRLPSERPDGGRRHTARRGSRDKADAVHFRPSSVAGATGARGGIRIVLCAPARAARRALHARRSVRPMGRRRPVARADGARASRLRCAASPTPAFPSVSWRAATATSCWASALPMPPARPCCPSSIVVDVAGTPTLLMHGDELCTADVAYQRFRARMRIGHAMRRLLRCLMRCAGGSRAGCGARAAREALSRKTSSTSKPAPSTRVSRQGVARIIHGHTHRPARHA